MSKVSIHLVALLLGCACSREGTGATHAPVGVPERWTPPALSTPLYEASPTFTADGRELFFMQADQGFDRYRLRETRCLGGRWTAPREPSFAAPAGMHDADPFVTVDGSRLYFVSTRHRFREVGNDDFDIFEVERQADGTWAEPRRLPEPVNSPASELLPRMDGAGHLYFGSSRAGGKGGSDIYRATRRGEAWTVTGVDAVNSTANEYEADVSPDGERLAVVSDRQVRSRIYLYRRDGDAWVADGRVHARDEVFQVGPRFSPDGRRLLFAQDAGADSGEMFLVDVAAGADPAWPPACRPVGDGAPASERAGHAGEHAAHARVVHLHAPDRDRPAMLQLEAVMAEERFRRATDMRGQLPQAALPRGGLDVVHEGSADALAGHMGGDVEVVDVPGRLQVGVRDGLPVHDRDERPQLREP